MVHSLPTLGLQLDPSSPVPLYEQMVEQVALAVASGRLVPGDRLPSVRELAGRLRVNPNTAARALRELDRMGLATARRGVGSLVPDGAAKIARRVARRILDRELESALRVARQLGMSARETGGALEARWKELEDAD